MPEVKIWSVPAEWFGETVFIIAGGPSVDSQPYQQLVGRKIIVINSSYEKFPDTSQYLYTMDNRWLKYHRPVLAATYKGVIVTNSQDARKFHADWKQVRFLNKIPPPGLATDPTYATGHRTSLHGAINLACHLTGWKGKIVLLGADGGANATGKTHHHNRHPWRSKNKTVYPDQLAELTTMLPVLKAHGVQVLNASPGTRWPIFPITDLETVLIGEQPAPFVICCTDIRKAWEFIVRECNQNFTLSKFMVITGAGDLKYLIPYHARNLKWFQIGYNEPEVIEKVRSMFGTDKERGEFMRLVQCEF